MDAELLARYLAGDERAFAELVDRHGAMVFGTCVRILQVPQDAEDAFQATFLLLARRAADVRPAAQVGRWLYGVARRTALKARARRARRRVVEARAGVRCRSTAIADDIPSDLWSVVDEEAGRLPERLQSPFVLCDLEGMTYRDAARQLGLPESTLSNRLASARRQLAGRLTRRGVAVSTGGLAGLFTPSSASAVPGKLVAATVAAAASGFPEQAVTSMWFVKLSNLLVPLAAALSLGLGGWFLLANFAEDPELKKLDGEWGVIRAERRGKELPAEEVVKMKVTFRAGVMTIHAGDRQEVATVTVDATTSPMSMDLRPRKDRPTQTELGIYELDGDTLKICWGNEVRQGQRWTEFRTTEGRGGRLLVLKRLKPE